MTSQRCCQLLSVHAWRVSARSFTENVTLVWERTKKHTRHNCYTCSARVGSGPVEWRPNSTPLTSIGCGCVARSGVVAGGAIEAINLSLSDNFLLVRKFSSKISKFMAQNPSFWGNLGAKLNFWATMISSVENLQLSAKKIAAFCICCPQMLSTQDAAGCTTCCTANAYNKSDVVVRLVGQQIEVVEFGLKLRSVQGLKKTPIHVWFLSYCFDASS